MNLEKINQALEDAIKDPEARVIAISGKWGTGKSYLWHNFQKTSREEKINNAIYISLFGVRTINDFKMKLLSATISNKNPDIDLLTYLKDTVHAAKKLLNGLHKSTEAIDNIALLFIPRILSNKFIVLDDIERKHKSLEINEILGFIEELTNKHKSRFILILNTDKLDDKALWDEFREKIIDNEISIEITAYDASAIAVEIKNFIYGKEFKEINKLININNIRALLKIISFTQKLLMHSEKLEYESRMKILSSIMLICAAHFKLTPNSPPIDFIENFNSLKENKDKHPEYTEENIEKWSNLMHDLRIYRTDAFDKNIATTLKTSIFNYEDINKYINDYQRPEKVNLATKRCKDFSDDYEWNSFKSNIDLYNEAREILEITEHMDIYAVSEICRILQKINQPNLEIEFSKKWLSTKDFSSTDAYRIITQHETILPPTILDHLRSIAEEKQVLFIDLVEIITEGSFVIKEDEIEKFISKIDAKEYEDTLRKLDKYKLKEFLEAHLRWDKFDVNIKWQKISLTNIKRAITNIKEHEPETRLAFILKKVVFHGNGKSLKCTTSSEQ